MVIHHFSFFWGVAISASENGGWPIRFFFASVETLPCHGGTPRDVDVTPANLQGMLTLPYTRPGFGT